MNMSLTKQISMKEFEVSTNDCNSTVRLYMNDDNVNKIVVMFPRKGNRRKVVTLEPKELLMLSELTGSLDHNKLIDPVLNAIEEKVVPIMLVQKIMAIKELRYITGLGLKDAKDEVEYMIDYGFDKWKKFRRAKISR